MSDTWGETRYSLDPDLTMAEIVKGYKDGDDEKLRVSQNLIPDGNVSMHLTY